MFFDRDSIPLLNCCDVVKYVARPSPATRYATNIRHFNDRGLGAYHQGLGYRAILITGGDGLAAVPSLDNMVWMPLL